MGMQTIEQLMEITEDGKFLKQLSTQFKEYTDINTTAKEMLNQNHFIGKDSSSFEKLSTYLMINLKTLTDKSSSHIAEMMIDGSNAGILDATKIIKEYSDAEPDILNLMKKLLKTEENNVKALKEFL